MPGDGSEILMARSMAETEVLLSCNVTFASMPGKYVRFNTISIQNHASLCQAFSNMSMLRNFMMSLILCVIVV